jgi:hypothetical protein
MMPVRNHRSNLDGDVLSDQLQPDTARRTKYMRQQVAELTAPCY